MKHEYNTKLAAKLGTRLIAYLSILLFMGCSQHGGDGAGARVGSEGANSPISFTLMYDNLLNDYQVMLSCKQAYIGDSVNYHVEIYLRDVATDYITEVINLERFFLDVDSLCMRNGDTIVIHNTHEEIGSPLLDVRNIVYFEDMNFDGKKELVVCIYPTKLNSSDILDCESFLIFEVYPYFLHPVDNRFTRKVAKALCRTDFAVDKKNKAVTLTEYNNAYESTEETYWFKNGWPYRLDYLHMDGEKKESCSFEIDNIDAVMDSLEISGYNNPTI